MIIFRSKEQKKFDKFKKAYFDKKGKNKAKKDKVIQNNK